MHHKACVRHYFAPCVLLVIAERISARHWITDCGPEIGSCMYVCMYVHHAFGMQLRISACAIATLFVPQICMHIPLLVCVCLHACMHCGLYLD